MFVIPFKIFLNNDNNDAFYLHIEDMMIKL